VNLLDVLILGVVEGLTEFLPVSSTGHLMLTARILNLAQTDFTKTFEISIQLGAILSVVLASKKSIMDIRVIKRVLTAFFPTALLGLILYKIVKNVLLDNTDIVLWALLIGGILLILFEKIHHEDDKGIDDLKKISYKKAFLIGVFQSAAMIPGVSRAAATILGGLVLGLKRKTIVEFSFLLAIPTMLASTIYDVCKSANTFTQTQIGLLIMGAGVSFVVAMVSIQFLLHFIKNHNFIWFGVYRILVAITFWFFLK